MKSPSVIALASALITAAAIKAAPALAEPRRPARYRVSIVQTADLDLSSSVGQRELDLPLAQAAREVCGTASDVDLEGKNEVRECRAQCRHGAGQRSSAIAAALGARSASTASR